MSENSCCKLTCRQWWEVTRNQVHAIMPQCPCCNERELGVFVDHRGIMSTWIEFDVRLDGHVVFVHVNPDPYKSFTKHVACGPNMLSRLMDLIASVE
jgi:hypothetical protein